MASFLRVLSVSLGISLLSACGGGGGDSGGNSTTPPPVTASQIIGNAKDYSAAQLKSAANDLVKARYTGKSSDAVLNVGLAQQSFNYLFSSETTNIPDVSDDDFRSELSANGNLDTRFTCNRQGSVTYKGKLDTSYRGNMSLSYQNCQGYNAYPISGNVAVSIFELSDSANHFTYYFDNLSWQVEGNSVKLSGFTEFKLQQINTGELVVNYDQQLLFVINGQDPLMISSEVAITYGSGEQLAFDITGELFMGENGKVSFSVEALEGYAPYFNAGRFQLSGETTVALEFQQQYIRYVEDNNNDGVFDVGTYFLDINELLNSDASSKQLYALELLSLPPSVATPRYDSSVTYNTTTPISVSAGYASDPDTPNDELELSYRWYINGEIVPDQNSSILPAYLAVFGDVVSVAMVVSDGVNLIEGQKINFTLQDAPAQIEITNLPDTVRSGDQVQFVVEITDPDVQVVEGVGILVSGPEGATIDDKGVVNWNVDNQLLFPYQTFEFVFGNTDENNNITETQKVEVRVDSSKAFPIARSGIEVPKFNASMTVGDFDGDGKNEVLSTDSANSVFLLEYTSNGYQQKWVYPFRLPTLGRILQVLAANIDEDDELEILAVTEGGVSVINGLNNIASVLFLAPSGKELRFATTADIGNDGQMEMAYLYSNSYSSSTLVNVISISDPQTSLFSTNIADVVQIVFANVDADSQLELVSNTGLVYDTDTWANQWLSSSQFGGRSVTAGDYNGDGVDEIAGANTWGAVGVYSAIDKSQLDSFDNFNTCSLASDDVDNDGKDELLVGDCQWGAIKAYKLVDNKLSELWSVDMQDHGSVSLTVGDADNDGKTEVIWGTGISHTGQDMLVVADIDGSSISVDEANISMQLDSYSSAGWSEVTPGQDRAVFFIPQTGSGYDGSRIATLDKQGNYVISDEISSNWDRSTMAATTDFNNDGLGDIFLPNTTTYTGSFAAMQLSNNSIFWQVSEGSSSNIGLIRAVDMNNDGYKDAVYSDNSKLNVMDVQNQLIIANYTFEASITDFAAFYANNKAFAAVAFNNKLSLLAINGSVFSEQAFVQQSCGRVELINYDSDPDLELVCLQEANGYGTKQALVFYDLADSKLTEVYRAELTDNVLDMAADTSVSSQQQLFVTTSLGDSYSYWNDDNTYQVKKYASNGSAIWSSPPLVGKPTSHGLKVRTTEEGKVELMLSTRFLMYWIH